MQDFVGKKIVLGICGGIAAYKSAYLVRELTRLGATVRVVLTQSAQAFITPMTLQALSGNEVCSELFDSQAERAMGHIELARWADYLVIAPASANCLAKLAHGMADDLLSTLYLVSETPVIACPAMNRSMWAHPATQENFKTLKHRGVIFVGPEEGEQACGEYGYGRMAEVEQIVESLRLTEIHQVLKDRQVLITAGPTREALDPVRYLTNRSSGKMGYALAKAARMAGADVTLISGPTALQAPSGVHRMSVETAEEMMAAVKKQLKKGMIFIGAAAVADYRIASPESQKIKKNQNKHRNIVLIENPDILAFVAASQKPAYVVGFAAETSEVLSHAQKKLKNKQLDVIVANQVGPNLGFDVDEHEVTLLTKDQQVHLPATQKTRLAAQIIAFLATNQQNKLQI